MEQHEFLCIEPAYLEHFFCDGSKCGGSICCYGWQQILDDAALARYRALEGEDGEKLRRGLVYLPEAENFGFLHKDDHCVFLRADGLCGLQKKYGAQMLTDVCAEYPRKTRLFPHNIVERALCVTCPVAAELILQNDEPMQLVKRQIQSTRSKYFLPSGDAEALAELNFFDWQARGMEILQNRELTLNQRLAMLLQELAKADEHLPWGRDASDVVWEPWPVAKQADFFCRFVRGIEDDTAKTAAYLELVEKVKVQGFMEQAAAQNLLWEKCEGPYGLMLENYLVNEWFKELYPCAVLGTYAYNGLYFVVQWEIWQFLLLLELTAAEKEGDVPCLIRETAGWLASRLNHYTTAQNVLMELLRDK